ncbi:hypothetical protein P153DRAFT_362660 [Dothidotthia symphoricarpi CBS 119687]|uniref:Uncharacterized protein n=1 Tax=Dothidotthia symphoricarpi CBS 119687 TaxID=1392245 RepID=A0A6A6AVT3_9PLEO|nr:uncharacterized protein P153DRAFT_362660 [Dothidotthia symphoricarpi CBS 119687]KAF2134947.1 hypothetical protein P153DRAFT_362660 [Dothidotthia symphoricarpi CBS 119687]
MATGTTLPPLVVVFQFALGALGVLTLAVATRAAVWIASEAALAAVYDVAHDQG